MRRDDDQLIARRAEDALEARGRALRGRAGDGSLLPLRHVPCRCGARGASVWREAHEWVRRMFSRGLVVAAVGLVWGSWAGAAEESGVASDFRYTGLQAGEERCVRFRVDLDGGESRDYRAFSDARVDIPGRRRAPIHEVYIWGLTSDRPRVRLRATDQRVYEATFTDAKVSQPGPPMRMAPPAVGPECPVGDPTPPGAFPPPRLDTIADRGSPS
jgi:hypothetical protein